MRLVLLTGISLYLFTSSTTSAYEALIDSPVKTGDIRVGTYNIMASRMGSTDDIVDAIKKMNVDIIGLQEVDSMTSRSGKNFSKKGSPPINQAEYIAKKLGLNFYFCKATDYDGGEYGTAVLSKFKVKVNKTMILPNIEGAEQRTACAVEVDVPNYPAPVMLITTHLDFTTQPLRAEQVRTLQTEFSSWQFPHALPIVIGDLNLPPQSSEYFDLTAWFNDTDKKLQYTAPSWNPDRKIDYILTSKAQEWNIKNVFIPKPTDEVEGKKSYALISDHLPMVVEMNLVRL
ncbi:endonuclease/exonuclease/phosphatase family protein [Aeromonas veronii]|uniref:endonuclease/exonuclease/phosphatase family protein n=1 Tax=Aeromonas veronii TaxID=654 RepID=UPI00214D4E2E|nr:endonuclease/exonuclease/phosphatase family protein [Aeromonas veronii]MCR3971007.1 endonuclease/exonuclease/phosphatase family protein [Aeromonas veronii]MCR3975518.1 endonuclease/exonuclease/phosphatase family protein [Aeromonas veronii]